MVRNLVLPANILIKSLRRKGCGAKTAIMPRPPGPIWPIRPIKPIRPIRPMSLTGRMRHT